MGRSLNYLLSIALVIMGGNYMGKKRGKKFKVMRCEVILLRLTKREATYLRFTEFRGWRMRGKEKEAESMFLDYNNKYSFGDS